jgi:hypothetical protein
MELASSSPRPLCTASHSSNFMPRILARYKSKSIARCEFSFNARCYPISSMQTVGKTRLARLHILIKKYGSQANLNDAIGLARTDATVSQIKNQNLTSRGNTKVMGEDFARRIETALKLPVGWMDTPPTYAELHNTPEDQHDPRLLAHKVMEDMPADKVRMALKLLSALAQPDEHGQAAAGS